MDFVLRMIQWQFGLAYFDLCDIEKRFDFLWDLRSIEGYHEDLILALEARQFK